MTTTSQVPDPAAKTGVSPAQGEGEGSAKTVPLGEHIELRQRLRAAEEQIAKLSGPAKNEPAAAPAAPAAAPAPDVVRDLQRRAQLQDLQEELGVSGKQAKAILDVMERLPSASPVEARSIATMRNADLFKEADDGFQPGIHAASRPGVAMPQPSKPQTDPNEDRLKAIKGMEKTNKRQADVYLNNMIGAMAAEDVGKAGHELLPLPQQR